MNIDTQCQNFECPQNAGMKFTGATSVSKLQQLTKQGLSKHFCRNTEIYYKMSMTFFDNETLDLMIRLAGSEEERRELGRGHRGLEIGGGDQGHEFAVFSLVSHRRGTRDNLTPVHPRSAKKALFEILIKV